MPELAAHAPPAWVVFRSPSFNVALSARAVFKSAFSAS